MSTNHNEISTFPLADDRNYYNKGLMFLVTGTILFSLKGIFIKLSYQYSVSTTQLLTIRMFFALPFYLWVLQQQFALGHHAQINIRQIVLISVFGLIGYYLASWLDLSGLKNGVYYLIARNVGYKTSKQKIIISRN